MQETIINTSRGRNSEAKVPERIEKKITPQLPQNPDNHPKQEYFSLDKRNNMSKVFFFLSKKIFFFRELFTNNNLHLPAKP